MVQLFTYQLSCECLNTAWQVEARISAYVERFLENIGHSAHPEGPLLVSIQVSPARGSHTALRWLRRPCL